MFDKKLPLEFRIVELCVGVAHFAAENKALETLDESFFAQFRIAVEFAEGCCLDRVVDDVVRLDEVLFCELFKEHGDKGAAGAL